MIREHIKLSFDPEKSSIEEVREVFSNPLARLIWLAVKPGHLTSQYFDFNCLRSAKEVQKVLDSNETLSGEKVFRILSPFGITPVEGIIGPTERDFADELVPFLTGEKTISYEICLPQTT